MPSWKMTLKNFSIEYDSVNSRNVFTNGDTINGRIIVEVSKETKIQELIFKTKGEASVCWSEEQGEESQTYSSNEKYYDVRQQILNKEIIGKGRHVFPFAFAIPDRKIASTFKGQEGRIVHKVKAELKRSMMLTKKAKAHFTFVSKADMDIPRLMEPQYRHRDVVMFGGGQVSLDVQTSQMGYMQGEGIKVHLKINNCSSCSVKPEFVLYGTRSFVTWDNRRDNTNVILKCTDSEAIHPSDKKTMIKVIQIPRELPPSITNCSIIKLEYMLKVDLNIKCLRDPEIKLPIVVLPVFEHRTARQPPPTAGFGFEASVSPNPAPWGMMPAPQAAPRAVDPPPPYEAAAVYPPLNDYGKYGNAF